jgi:hypothetical protein
MPKVKFSNKKLKQTHTIVNSMLCFINNCKTLKELYNLPIPFELKKELPKPNENPIDDEFESFEAPKPSKYVTSTSTYSCYLNLNHPNIRALFYMLDLNEWNTDNIKIIEMTFQGVKKISTLKHKKSLGKKSFRNSLSFLFSCKDENDIVSNPVIKLSWNGNIHATGPTSKQQFQQIVKHIQNIIWKLSVEMIPFNQVMQQLKLKQIKQIDMKEKFRSDYLTTSIMKKVFPYLDNVYLTRLRLVCSEFRGIVNDPTLWMTKISKKIGYKIKYDQSDNLYKVVYPKKIPRNSTKTRIYKKKRSFKDPQSYYLKYHDKEKIQPYEFTPIQSYEYHKIIQDDKLVGKELHIVDEQVFMVNAQFSANFKINRRILHKIFDEVYDVHSEIKTNYHGLLVHCPLNLEESEERVKFKVSRTGTVGISAVSLDGLEKGYHWICEVLRRHYHEIKTQ